MCRPVVSFRRQLLLEWICLSGIESWVFRLLATCHWMELYLLGLCLLSLFLPVFTHDRTRAEWWVVGQCSAAVVSGIAKDNHWPVNIIHTVLGDDHFLMISPCDVLCGQLVTGPNLVSMDDKQISIFQSIRGYLHIFRGDVQKVGQT